MLCKTKKKNTFVAEIACRSHFLFVICVRFKKKASKRGSEGEVLEWLKRHAWKACIRQKRITGSNPVLSARR